MPEMPESPLDTTAAVRMAERYLAGRPGGPGAERDAKFWSTADLRRLPADVLRQEPWVLALAKYLAQDVVAAPATLEHVARVAPDSVRRAVRLSGLVRRPGSPRRSEVARLGKEYPGEFGDFVAVLEVYYEARRVLTEVVDPRRRHLAGLSVVEFLTYAGLYACRHMAADLTGPVAAAPPVELRPDTVEVRQAIESLLRWKLERADPRDLQPSVREIERSLSDHVWPLLPGSTKPAHVDVLDAFIDLMDGQAQLDGLDGSVADAWSYNEPDIAVTRDGNSIRSQVGMSPEEEEVWRRRVERRSAVRRYWLGRGFAEFARRGLWMPAAQRPGNRMGFVKALAAHLRLVEVYGVAETATVHPEQPVPLFNALLVLELLTTSFEDELTAPYRHRVEREGSWLRALVRRAGRRTDGFAMQLPLAWADRTEAVRQIAGWLKESDGGSGDMQEAQAVLDFWTIDCRALRRRLRRDPAACPVPRLSERPILGMGDRVFALPWMAVGVDASEAAVNNLRRVGWRRAQAQEETHRIEERLGDLFRRRGFAVAANWTPQQPAGDSDAGEVDLVCARDGGVVVLEVKSTWMRSSQRDIWLHAQSLRWAGVQLRRKARAVAEAIEGDADFAADLRIGTANPDVRGWIVDTSLDYCGQEFGGFPTVALEEILIALRDDGRLLRQVDRRGLLKLLEEARNRGAEDTALMPGLYPSGFSFTAFVHVLESGGIWRHER